MTIYNKIGRKYDETRSADARITKILITLLNPSDSQNFLDIGCGTGNYTIALQKNGFSLVGLDPSEVMLNQAKQKNSTIDWVQAFCEDTPFLDESFDGAICIFAIHHFLNLQSAFKEVFRILRNDSRFVIFTGCHEQLKNYWLNHYFPSSMKRLLTYMPDIELVQKSLFSAGFKTVSFEDYEIDIDLTDHFLYSNKHDPIAYTDKEFLYGSSLFSGKSTEKEIDDGISMLLSDIKNGEINDVIKRYQNDKGDYKFVIANK